MWGILTHSKSTSTTTENSEENTNSPSDGVETATARALNIWFSAAVAILVLCLLAYFIWFYFVHQQMLSPNANTWGTFGDFIGGIANPLIALFTLNFVIRAYNLQSLELVETRVALEESSREQSLNRQITALNAMMSVELANLEHVRQRKSGREAYRLFLCERGARKQAGYNFEGKMLDAGGIRDLVSELSSQIESLGKMENQIIGRLLDGKSDIQKLNNGNPNNQDEAGHNN
ncbi:hypothetical protein [Kordiimonas sp.]|uniref:hypothetical protein n=1 Tax=Kordiimonas sp. TaxID=1970157 RepID=UPI003A8E4553